MIDMILTLGVIYCIVVATYLLFTSSSQDKKHSNKSVDRLADQEIMKIRHYTQSHTIPVATTSPKEEPMENIEPIFAPEESKTVPQIPNDKLDDAFSNTPEDIDIDTVQLKYEEGITEDELDDEDLESNNGQVLNYASGFRIDEFKGAIDTIKSTNATNEKRDKAGELFCDIKGSDLFEQLTKNKDSNMSKIKELMDFHLGRMDKVSEKDNSNKKSKNTSPVIPKKYEDFNVFDIL